MSMEVNSPASAGTLPGHGSHIPQKETEMNNHADSISAAEKPVLSRRRATGSAVEPHLVALINAHREAVWEFGRAILGTDEIRLGRSPTPPEEERVDAASEAVDETMAPLLAYVPMSDASRRAKADYIHPFTVHAQLSEDEMRILLLSMCGRFA